MCPVRTKQIRVVDDGGLVFLLGFSQRFFMSDRSPGAAGPLLSSSARIGALDLGTMMPGKELQGTGNRARAHSRLDGFMFLSGRHPWELC